MIPWCRWSPVFDHKLVMVRSIPQPQFQNPKVNFEEWKCSRCGEMVRYWRVQETA